MKSLRKLLSSSSFWSLSEYDSFSGTLTSIIIDHTEIRKNTVDFYGLDIWGNFKVISIKNQNVIELLDKKETAIDVPGEALSQIRYSLR